LSKLGRLLPTDVSFGLVTFLLDNGLFVYARGSGFLVTTTVLLNAHAVGFGLAGSIGF